MLKILLFKERVITLFLIHAGQEIGVASTKAFTMQCLVGRYFVELLSGKSLGKEFEAKVILLSKRVEELIKRSEEIKNIAHALYLKTAYFFTGRGELFSSRFGRSFEIKGNCLCSC